MTKKLSSNKIAIAFTYVFLDILVIGGIYALSAIQTFKVATDSQIANLIYFGLAVVALVQIAFWAFRVYFILTSNFGIIESLKIMLIVFVILIISYLVMLVIPNEILPSISPELFVLALFSSVFLVPAMRYVRRVSKFVISNLKKNSKTVRTLIIGAGAAAKIVIDEARRNPKSKNDIIVIVDDDSNKIGGVFAVKDSPFIVVSNCSSFFCTSTREKLEPIAIGKIVSDYGVKKFFYVSRIYVIVDI